MEAAISIDTNCDVSSVYSANVYSVDFNVRRAEKVCFPGGMCLVMDAGNLTQSH